MPVANVYEIQEEVLLESGQTLIFWMPSFDRKWTIKDLWFELEGRDATLIQKYGYLHIGWTRSISQANLSGIWLMDYVPIWRAKGRVFFNDALAPVNHFGRNCVIFNPEIAGLGGVNLRCKVLFELLGLYEFPD